MFPSTIEKGRVKRILKASASCNQTAFDIAEDTSLEYSKIMTRLLKFKKDSKHTTKVNSQRLQWCSEQSLLTHSANRIENDVTKLLQQLLFSSITESRSSIHSSINESTVMQTERTSIQDGLWQQLLELKSILASVVKASNKQKTKLNNVNNDATTSSSTSNVSTARCIFADLLMNSISSHAENWQQLVSRERELSDSLKLDVIRISKMLKNDRKEEQNKKLCADLHLDTLGDEDWEVELAIEDWMRQLDTLDRGHSEAISSVSMEHSQRCTIKFEVEPTDLFGGWPEKEHEIFVKIIRRAREVGSRKDLKAQLIAAFTGTTLGDSEILDLHEQWYNSYKSLLAKKKDLTATYTSKRSELITQAIAAIAEVRDTVKEQREKEARLKQHEEYRLELHKRLCIQRAEREELDREAAVRRAEEELMQFDQITAESIQALQEAEAKRQLVKEYQLERERQQALKAKQEETLRLAYERTLKESVAINRVNVERREAILVEREEERKRKEEEYNKQEQRRLELLAKIAEQVPYWENIQNATSKLDYITIAARGQEYVKGEEPGRGHMPLHGFTDKNVFSDARFRIAFALRAAGVHTSEAAKNLVMKMHSRQAAPI